MTQTNHSALSIFAYKGHDVRTILRNGEPEWVAMDVCKILDIKNSRKALTSLDADEKGVTISDTLGGAQELATVNESGLYSLILRSRKPEAKAFKRWITHEVLPALRRRGSYSVTGDVTPPAIPQELVSAVQDIASALRNFDARLQRIETQPATHQAASSSPASRHEPIPLGSISTQDGFAAVHVYALLTQTIFLGDPPQPWSGTAAALQRLLTDDDSSVADQARELLKPGVMGRALVALSRMHPDHITCRLNGDTRTWHIIPLTVPVA